jgi:hypothetical protein
MTDETLRERIEMLRYPPFTQTITSVGLPYSDILADVLDNLLTRIRQLEGDKS